MNTYERILLVLKTRGARTAQELGVELEMTSMGARRHLEQAEAEGLAKHMDHADKVGRPTRRWLLTDAGNARFPDRHSDLTVQLLDNVRSVFGEAGLEQLIAKREQASEAQYMKQLEGLQGLVERARALAKARADEGYMAAVEEGEQGELLLVENHCPICAAARNCQGFCRSELAVFQRVLGPQCQVERSEYVLDGGRRCAYLIRPLPAA